jgi:hypothetical protein
MFFWLVIQRYNILSDVCFIGLVYDICENLIYFFMDIFIKVFIYTEEYNVMAA